MQKSMSYNNAMLVQIAAEMKRIGTEVWETHDKLDVDAVADILDALKMIVEQYESGFYKDMATCAIALASNATLYNDPECDEYEQLLDLIMSDKGYSNSIGDMYDVYVRRMDY